jgi:tetratricopeptide (TPR) repeat protein
MGERKARATARATARRQRKRERERAAVSERTRATESRTEPRQIVAMATISDRARLWQWVSFLTPLAWGALLYVRTTTFDFSFLDDAFLKDEQPLFSRLSNLGGIVTAFRSLYVLGTYYRPLVTVSYVLDSQWSGGNPFGYHLTNLMLHLTAIALVYVLLIRLRFSRPVSAFAASLFAIHPALVETVAWIPGRNDSLFVVFALGAWLFLTYDVERASFSHRLGHVACLLAALFTKETAVVLPLLFAVYIWSIGLAPTLLKSRRFWPLWILGVAGYAAVRARVVASQHTQPGEFAHTLLAHVPVLLSGLGKLCVPIQLSPLATARDTAAWPGVVAAVGIATAVALTRGSRPKILFLAASTYLLPLVPTLFVAERLTLENRLYLPAVGLCIFVAEMVSRAAARWPARRRLLAAIGTGVLVGFVPIAWAYASGYRNRETLGEASVAFSPSSALAHLQRGDAYYTIEHDLDNAEGEYRRAIELDPRELVVHNNLAVVLMARRRFPDAETELRNELGINPHYAPAHYNLGLVLRQTGRLEEAAAEWERTLESDPNHVNAMGELLVYYSSRGEQTKAAYYADQMARRGMKFVTPPHADR